MSTHTGGVGLVGFNQGPYSETAIDGILASLIILHQPRYMCVDADGRWEHYVAVDDCPEHTVCYEHTGPCRDRQPHEDCGHDHDYGEGSPVNLGPSVRERAERMSWPESGS